MENKISNSLSMNGKKVLVTGIGGGIGTAIGKLFNDHGAMVMGLGAKAAIEAEYVDYYVCDVSNKNQCDHIISKLLNQYDHIDVLVNCAGITQDALTCKMTEAQFDEVISVNLKGVWNVTHLIGANMQKRGYGSIVNISSVVGLYGNIGQANYAASKAGIIGLTKSWAKEFALKGGNVRVNAVAPGYTMTNMIKTVPDNLLHSFASQTMLGRLAQPEEIANAVLFLGSDMASYITGTVLKVDGGMRL